MPRSYDWVFPTWPNTQQLHYAMLCNVSRYPAPAQLGRLIPFVKRVNGNASMHGIDTNRNSLQKRIANCGYTGNLYQTSVRGVRDIHAHNLRKTSIFESRLCTLLRVKLCSFYSILSRCIVCVFDLNSFHLYGDVLIL